MLIDYAKIYVSGGRGGNGCQSLYKDIFNRRGVPDGGDGGDGGNVIIRSDRNLHTLLDFRYNQHHSAGHGRHGGSNKKYGKRGKDLVLKVPEGTIVKSAEDGFVLRDLVSCPDQVIAAKGGTGGKGSAKLVTATQGEMGETKTLILELKLVADVGIIGLPNAGKSTLISKISKAHSKIAPYPFTTKSPKLGVVKFYEDSLVVADMPGLIEGAHSGKGLGDRFLRHIERTRLLVHMVDLSALDGSDPVENYLKLENELKLYNEDVYAKPRVIAANKLDLPSAKTNLEKIQKVVKKQVFAISALTGEGVKELLGIIFKTIKDIKKSDEENYDQSWDKGFDE
ncbi:MAG: GTPase ObgE [Candidatus Omnitrophota bacterium]